MHCLRNERQSLPFQKADDRCDDGRIRVRHDGLVRECSACEAIISLEISFAIVFLAAENPGTGFSLTSSSRSEMVNIPWGRLPACLILIALAGWKPAPRAKNHILS